MAQLQVHNVPLIEEKYIKCTRDLRLKMSLRVVRASRSQKEGCVSLGKFESTHSTDGRTHFFKLK